MANADKDNFTLCSSFLMRIVYRIRSELPDLHGYVRVHYVALVEAISAGSTLFLRLKGMLASEDWSGVETALRIIFPAVEQDMISHGALSERVTTGSVPQLQADWSRPFTGNALANLCRVLDSLEQRYPRANYYGKMLPIIQSSGVGKSRLVDGLCKSRVGLSFALRKHGQTGYPPGDVDVTDFFLSFQ